METPTWTVEQTYFVPKTGLDAANYVVLGSEIKVAAHAEVPANHIHLINDLRSIIDIHKLTFRAEAQEDRSIKKSVGREVISRMDDLLERLDEAGLWLTFQMWPLPIDKRVNEVGDGESDDQYDPHDLDEYAGDEIVHRSQVDAFDLQSWNAFGYGATVAFLIVPKSLPFLVPKGVGHIEVCVNQAPDWSSLVDELTHG